MIFVWHFLVANGLYRYFVGWLVGFVFGVLIVGTIRRTVKRLWREHVHTQQKIADSLDTSTPGGLSDLRIDVSKLADEIAEALDRRERRR